MKYLQVYKIAICDRCGLKKPHGELRRDGDVPSLLVCSPCWDPRDPRRNLQTKVGDISIKNARPEEPLTTQ